MREDNGFDVIVVGAGTAGSTLARELTRKGRKVLLLERGGAALRKEGIVSFARVADEVQVGDKLTASRGIAIGGSSNLYFGVTREPPLGMFRALGIDLGAELDAVRKELPIGPLPDRLISAKSLRLRDSAMKLGHAWYKHEMLVDPERCERGYTYQAIWKAGRYADEAVSRGATLIKGARAHRVLTERGRAVGVEYSTKTGRIRGERRRVYGADVVLAAGELETPKMLLASGIRGVGSGGFICNPGYVLYGIVPGLHSNNSFVGTMGGVAQEGVELGDANVSRFLHRLMMLSGGKLRHLFNYPGTVGIGVKVADGLSGEFTEDGGFAKQLDAEDFAKLERGEAEARRILTNAGARHIFNVGLVCAGRVGGLVCINEHVDKRLETEYRNLYVCDGSIVPTEMRGPPTLTLICLARYLANQLSTHHS